MQQEGEAKEVANEIDTTLKGLGIKNTTPSTSGSSGVLLIINY